MNRKKVKLPFIKNLPRSQRGVTLVELIVSTGIAIVGLLAVFQVGQIVYKQNKKVATNVEAKTGASFLEKILYQDLSSIDKSYNNVIIQDDRGHSFFDYQSELPEQNISGEISRMFTLAANREFIFISQDEKSGPTLVYDPVAAYNVGSAPADFNQSASLSFQSLNRDSWITHQRPEFWRNGKVLMLDSTARVRKPLDGYGRVNLQTPARSPIYIGMVSGQTLSQVSGVSSYLNFKHPLTESIINSADNFLRTLPSSGGGIPLVRITPVKIIKYRMEPDTNSMNSLSQKLVKYEFDGRHFVNPSVLDTNIQSLVFKRDNITELNVKFYLQKFSQ